MQYTHIQGLENLWPFKADNVDIALLGPQGLIVLRVVYIHL
jgi:hypothetical protein